MKKTSLKWLLCCTSACLLAGTAFGQADYKAVPKTSSDANQTSTSQKSTQSTQFCRSKDLVGAAVKDAQGQKLGDIKEVFINPKNGQNFAAIGIGHGREALVPLQALNVMPARGLFKNAEVTLNKTKADLESSPSVTNDEWQKLDDPTFTQSIYSHYNIQAPSAMGGANTPSGVSSGSSKPSSSQR